jgi:alpha-methylacyl-CoA racemase
VTNASQGGAGALADLHILTIAQNVPGPVAVARLVSEGARAVKIEPPPGDPLAAMCPPWYDELHRGVEVERVDLKTADGRARVMTLAAAADLFLTSQRPSALRRLSLDAASLTRAHPHLRILRIVGSCLDPEAPGHDLTYQARAGLLSDSLPVTLIADLTAAERTVTAALLLLRRPQGSVLDVGLSESLQPLLAPLRHGLTTRSGILGGGWPPYGVYPARSGHVAVAAIEPHFQRRLFEELGIAPGEALAPALRARTAVEWEAWAMERDLPIVAVVRDYTDFKG